MYTTTTTRSVTAPVHEYYTTRFAITVYVRLTILSWFITLSTYVNILYCLYIDTQTYYYIDTVRPLARPHYSDISYKTFTYATILLNPPYERPLQHCLAVSTRFIININIVMVLLFVCRYRKTHSSYTRQKYNIARLYHDKLQHIHR